MRYWVQSSGQRALGRMLVAVTILAGESLAERRAVATTASAVLAGIVLFVAIGNLTVLVLTGDSGSRSVWGPLMQ